MNALSFPLIAAETDAEAPPSESAARMTVVTFSIGGQRLALPAAHLRQILDSLPVTRVPGAPLHVPGVVNVRGAVLPLVDLAALMAIERPAVDPALARMILAEVAYQGQPLALVLSVDGVHEVVELAAADLRPAPGALPLWPPESVTGIFSRPEGLVVLPDLERLLALAAAPSAPPPASFRSPVSLTQDR
jgi:purine-binding chemotaxis protein CheW